MDEIRRLDLGGACTIVGESSARGRRSPMADGSSFDQSPSGLPYDRPVGEHVQALYQKHFTNTRRERGMLGSLSFFTTFATVRIITHTIRSGRGPFHNVSAGGRHIHHMVWGILLLLLMGYAWLLQIGVGIGEDRRWSRETALLYGMGAALTLDEFALWLNLADDYWLPQGRESVDAVILFGGFLSFATWGQPFFRDLGHILIRRGAHPSTS